VLIYGVSILTLGWDLHLSWLHLIQDFSNKVNPYVGNESVAAWVSRTVLGHSGSEEISFTAPLISWLKVVLPLVFGGVTAAAMWSRKGKFLPDQQPMAAGIVLSAVLLSVVTAWEHYWIFLLPSVAWAIYVVWSEGDTRFWQVWLAAAVFFFTMKLTHFYGDSPSGRIMSGSQTLGLILMWVWFVRRMWLPPRSEPQPIAS
jgi:hypothetical protein